VFAQLYPRGQHRRLRSRTGTTGSTKHDPKGFNVFTCIYVLIWKFIVKRWRRSQGPRGRKYPVMRGSVDSKSPLSHRQPSPLSPVVSPGSQSFPVLFGHSCFKHQYLKSCLLLNRSLFSLKVTTIHLCLLVLLLAMFQWALTTTLSTLRRTRAKSLALHIPGVPVHSGVDSTQAPLQANF
jgi:hypothetical protein